MIDSGANFCGGCGGQQVCSSCDDPLTKGQRYCAKCGDEVQKSEVSTVESKQGRRSFPMFMWAILGGLVVLFFFQYLFSDDAEVFSFGGFNQSPEVVVEEVFEAVEMGDMQKAGRFMDTSLLWDMDFDSDGVPPYVTIDVLDMESETSGNYSSVYATVEVYPEPYFGNPVSLFIELERVNGKWMIYEIDEY